MKVKSNFIGNIENELAMNTHNNARIDAQKAYRDMQSVKHRNVSETPTTFAQ